MTLPLAGKVAIVTGAASGIGRATARRFAGAGARLIAFDRSDAVRDVAAQIEDDGDSALAVTGDAGSEADIAALVDMAERQLGRLDIFHANAGISGQAAGGFFDATPDIWMETLRINLIGPFLAVKHGAPAIARHA